MTGPSTLQTPPAKTEGKKKHDLASAFALAARVIARVLEGASLNESLSRLAVDDSALRAAAQDLSYNTLRAWGRSDVMVAGLVDKPLADIRIRALLLVSLTELRSNQRSAHSIVHQAVEASGILEKPQARGLINAVLRNYQRSATSWEARINATETGRYAHPQWWIDILKAAYPDRWCDLLELANGHPPMGLRVNRRQGNVADYLQELAQAGIAARVQGEDAVVLERPMRVDRLPGFAQGRVSVQDAGAQHAAHILDVQDGMRVLDACAAPGGKCGHILEIASCEMIAIDSSAERIRRIHENLRRLHLECEVRVGDSCHPEKTLPQGKRFDRILLDAPCSASGVLRRHPDIRWLRREADLASFAATQARMLEALWPLLEADGKLLYTTCSVFPIENEAQIASFLARTPDARQLDIAGLPNGMLLPGSANDGFYHALLGKLT